MLLRRRYSVFLLLAVLTAGRAAGAQGGEQLTEALRKLATLPPDACEAPGADESDKHPEEPVFKAVASAIEARLNGTSGTSGTPEQRVHAALAEAMQEAVVAQAVWPDDSRFRGEVISAGPALVVTMFVRTRARWFAFGNVDGRWKQVGEDDGDFDDSPRRLMQVHRLTGAQPGVARFLAARTFFGCAGSSGISYEVREWNPHLAGGYVTQVLKQEGAFGMDQAADDRVPSEKDPFPPVGKLMTDGPVLALPYCTFTAIDTWDNPSLCALDRYALRGRTIRFLSRRYNRPELVPVAKALEYAAEHDLPAVRAYCASDRLARQLMFEGGPGSDGEVEITSRDRGKRIWFGDRESWFDVEKRGGRWIIVRLSKAD